MEKIIYNNAPTDLHNIIGIPYATIIQIVLSILIPIIIFYLGIKATIRNSKKKEIARLLVLKEYYYLWVKEILKDTAKQNENHRKTCIDLFKLNHLSGVVYERVNLNFNQLDSIDTKDLYKIFLELNSNTDTKAKAKNLIDLSKKLLFLDTSISQLKDDHKIFIDNLVELRNKWNAQIVDLHTKKDLIVKGWTEGKINNEFFVNVNQEFNNWYDTQNYSGLDEVFTFVRKIELLTKIQYNETPESKPISDLLFAIQGLIITYMTFREGRLGIFQKYKYYYKAINTVVNDLNTIIESMRLMPTVSWKGIKSYQ